MTPWLLKLPAIKANNPNVENVITQAHPLSIGSLFLVSMITIQESCPSWMTSLLLSSVDILIIDVGVVAVIDLTASSMRSILHN